MNQKDRRFSSIRPYVATFKRAIDVLVIFSLLLFSTVVFAKKSQQVGAVAIVPQANVQNLSLYLNQIVQPQQYRNFNNREELNRVSAWIKVQMEKFNLPCFYQNYPVEGMNYRNVVCRLDVGKPNKVIVGAHYDVHGETDGADDNASGVAGVIETAKLLSKSRQNLNYNVEFVLYTLEEPPFFRTAQMGSAVHANSVVNQRNKIVGVYILEMIGYFDPDPIQSYPVGLKWFYPPHGDFIGAVSNFQSNRLATSYCDAMKRVGRLDCQKLVAPSFVTGVDFSDHLNYWKLNIPAIMITDTAFYRNQNYHTEGDTLDTLNVEKMKDVVDGVVLSILTLK